jgi:Na+/phosphate symporter
MKDISRIEMLDMAINILQQSKLAQKSCEDIRRKTSNIGMDYFKVSDRKWAKHIYNVIRSGVAIIEMTTEDLTVLSLQDFFKPPLKDEESEDNDEDEYDE